MIPTLPPCPRCGSRRLIRFGIVAGKQRRRCKRCRYQFTRPEGHGTPEPTKRAAVSLYGHGLSFNTVAHLLGTTAQSVLRWVWSEAGGVLRGRVRAGATPAEATLLYRYESEPLANLVRDMNKFSNNVMARHIFLALSAEKTAGNGEIRASERLVRDWLKARGIAAPELALENGSGLSRDSRASAATIAAVLRNAWASPLMPELSSSFPLLAVDGTLKNRGIGSASGRAHLKGGTLAGVQSQAGYVLDTRGRWWIVVMMVNHANANAAQPALDALVEWVASRSDKR